MSRAHRKKRRQTQFFRRTSPGAAPGTLAVDPHATPPVVRVMAYDAQTLFERQAPTAAEVEPFLGQGHVVWVNVEGLGDAATLQKLAQMFGLHPLALEDVVNTHQRAKVEQYGEVLFIVARMSSLGERLETEQVSLFLGRGFVLTFLEDPGDSFDPVRERLRQGHAKLRAGNSGYLAYALLDAVIDAYFPIIEAYGDRLDVLEDDVILRPDQHCIARVHDAKRDLRTLRRAVWPLREALGLLNRDECRLLDAETHVHLRDCHDHVIQIIDLVETYRELGSDLTDLYLSSLSNRLNEVMKVLTIISTVFIPLSFVAGVYGMNFNPESSPWNMPELKWRWGYPFALSIMAAMVVSMAAFFYRKGWLWALTPTGGASPHHDPEKSHQ